MSYPGWEAFVPLTRAELRAQAQAGDKAIGEEMDAALARLSKPVKPSKMRNVRTKTGGRIFDSKREAAYFQELRLRLKAGEISQLELRPMYPLHTLTPDGEWVRLGKYTPDFRWREKNGVVVTCDVKSPASRTEAYEMRKRHVEAEHGITITEVE